MPDIDKEKGRERERKYAPKVPSAADAPQAAGDESEFLMSGPPRGPGVLSRSARIRLIARLEVLEDWLPKTFPERDLWVALCKGLVADDRIPSRLTGKRFVAEIVSRMASLPLHSDAKEAGIVLELDPERKAALVHQVPQILAAVCDVDGESQHYAEFLLDVRRSAARFENEGGKFAAENKRLLLQKESKSLAGQLDHLADMVFQGGERQKAADRVSELKERVAALENLPPSSSKRCIAGAFRQIEEQMPAVRALAKTARLSWEILKSARAFEAHLKLLRENVEERIE